MNHSYTMPQGVIDPDWTVVNITIEVRKEGCIYYSSLKPIILEMFATQQEALDYLNMRISGLYDTKGLFEVVRITK